MAVTSFKDLVVWQRGISLAKHTYLATSSLPKEEKYGLISQMRRCAVSIPSNIAEGKQRGTKKDFVQFLRISAGSAAELETQIILVSEIYPQSDFTSVSSDLEEVQKMLSTMISKLAISSKPL